MSTSKRQIALSLDLDQLTLLSNMISNIMDSQDYNKVGLDTTSKRLTMMYIEIELKDKITKRLELIESLKRRSKQ